MIVLEVQDKPPPSTLLRSLVGPQIIPASDRVDITRYAELESRLLALLSLEHYAFCRYVEIRSRLLSCLTKLEKWNPSKWFELVCEGTWCPHPGTRWLMLRCGGVRRPLEPLESFGVLGLCSRHVESELSALAKQVESLPPTLSTGFLTIFLSYRYYKYYRYC